ncbi:MAG: hypothetical protein B6D63_03715 [Candidatus Latescibacteria bacterium 4484_7]|nr:MAG: hypothetical protein B6D63_03715 [Candidatus Latescibacteria bacterium 4484_7]
MWISARVEGMDYYSNKKNRVKGIIVAHGNLAEELISTTELIVGKVSDFYAVSGSNMSSEDVVKRIKEILSDGETEKAVIFVDYFGGSTYTNSIRAVRDMDNIYVISGVNLPIILDFVTKREAFDFGEMLHHLIERGKESIRILK